MLISSIYDIDKSRGQHSDTQSFLRDTDFYDQNLKSDELIFRDLAEEAYHTAEIIEKATKLMRKTAEKNEMADQRAQEKIKKMIGEMKKISYNFRANIDSFIKEFVGKDGIKRLMELLVEAQSFESNELIAHICNILSTIFNFKVGTDAIKKKPRKYFEKFFELSGINENVKKQIVKIFYNITLQMTDSFDNIEKAAMSYARDSETMPFETLISGLTLSDV